MNDWTSVIFPDIFTHTIPNLLVSIIPAIHLPALVVIIPLLAAPLTLLVGRFVQLGWLIALIATISCLLASIGLTQWVFSGGVISYQLGGYPPPIGIAFQIDPASAMVLLVISVASLAVMLFARQSIIATLPPSRRIYFYTCFLLALSGLNGVVATADAFNMFVFLEISSLASYVLIALGGHHDRRALSAAYNYLILGTIGATLFVLGVGFLYAATGTLNMNDLASKMPLLIGNQAIQTGFALIFTGLALKIAIFPLHFWLPNAYSFAPNAVTAFLAASATKAALYALIRFFFSVFGTNFGFEQVLLEFLIMPLALTGMFIASAIAIFQTDMRRMLAWSSIAQIGFMILAISLNNQDGVEAAFLHIFNHAFMKAALFMAIGCVALRQGSYAISALNGLARKQPWTALTILIGGASLFGVPLTSGFISKWVLLEAALEKNTPIIAFLIVAASLLTAIYVGRMIQAMYFSSPDNNNIEKPSKEAPLSMLLPALLMAALTIYFGIDTRLPISLSSEAAQILLQPPQQPTWTWP